MSKITEKDAIVVENLSKTYRMWNRPSARLNAMVQQRLRRLIGQDFDPTAKGICADSQALRKIDLKIAQGECLGIVGRNGSGKSTLLKILSGILSPTSGNFCVHGRLAALLELGAGFNDEFTGRENVYLNGAIFGFSRTEIEHRIPAIEEFAGIGEYFDQKIKTYSSGMLVRIAFSVMVHVDPDILIIDEALAVGDGAFVQKCMRWLQQFIQERTAILVSHDMAAITRFCTRAIWLESGEIRFQGSPKETTEKYFETLYETTNTSKGAAPPLPPDVEMLETPKTIEAPSGSLHVFRFDPNAESFGQNSARITDVTLFDSQQNPISTITGGEIVSVTVTFEALETIYSPIVGFGVKNHHGQELFHENTTLNSLREANAPLELETGERAEASFRFRIPYFPSGEYFIFAAIATGTHTEHVQQHWCHEAVRFVATPSRTTLGLIGLPMIGVELKKTSIT